MKWLISVAVAVAMLLGGAAMASPALALELPNPTVPPEPAITVPNVPADFALPDVTLPAQCARDHAPVFPSAPADPAPPVEPGNTTPPADTAPAEDTTQPEAEQPAAQESVSDDAVAESSESAQVESPAAVSDAVVTAS